MRGLRAGDGALGGAGTTERKLPPQGPQGEARPDYAVLAEASAQSIA